MERDKAGGRLSFQAVVSTVVNVDSDYCPAVHTFRADICGAQLRDFFQAHASVSRNPHGPRQCRFGCMLLGRGLARERRKQFVNVARLKCYVTLAASLALLPLERI